MAKDANNSNTAKLQKFITDYSDVNTLRENRRGIFYGCAVLFGKMPADELTKLNIDRLLECMWSYNKEDARHFKIAYLMALRAHGEKGNARSRLLANRGLREMKVQPHEVERAQGVFNSGCGGRSDAEFPAWLTLRADTFNKTLADLRARKEALWMGRS